MQKIFLSIIIFSFFSCSQKPKSGIDSNIRNTRTANQVNIPGTRVYMTTPAGFKFSPELIGFRKGDFAMITVYDMVGGNYNTNIAQFTKQELESKGIKVYEYKNVTVDGFPGRFIHVQGQPGRQTYDLIFGDNTFSTMVMAAFPALDQKAAADIIHSMNSIYYDTSKKIDPTAIAGFTVNDSMSPFKFRQFSANVFLYTPGGKEIKGSEDAPMVIISQVPRDQADSDAKSVATLLLSQVQNYGLSSPEMKNISMNSLNGYDTFQGEIHGQFRGKPMIIYCCIIGRGNLFVWLEGFAKNDFDNNLDAFKKMAATLRIK